MGGEYRRTTVKQFFDSGFRSRLNFDNFNEFLAGIPGSGRQATTVAAADPLTPFSGTSLRNTAQNNVGFYLQDSWRIHPRFTINPGPAYNGVGPNPTLFSFSPTGPLTAGVPVFDPASFSAADVFTVDQGIRTPYVQNYNLNIEQQLGSHAAVQVGYVGSAGR